MKNFKIIILIIAIILVIVGIAFVGYGIYRKQTLKSQNPIVTMEIEDYGTMKIELYPDKAPNTVTNFICLANRGVYNGLTFHRTIPGFMIQGGDKRGDGTGSPKMSDIKDNVEENKDREYNIPGEFIANGYTKNNIKHEKGVISMARSDYGSADPSLTQYGYNSAGSQFFIMAEDNKQLDGMYAAFGKVIEGIEVVDKIVNTEVYYRSQDNLKEEDIPKDENGKQISPDTPKKAPKIKSVTVETYGADYGTPETVVPFDYNAWLMQQYGIAM